MPSLEQQLQRSGLELLGPCTDLSRYQPCWRHGMTLLEGLDPHEMETLGSFMPRVRAQPGQTLIAEGDVGEWMLLLLAGTVDVTKKSADGGSARLAVLKQGAALGEMSMFDAAPRYASCLALETVEAGVLTRSAITQLLAEHPAVGAKLLLKLNQTLARHLRNTSHQLNKTLHPRAPAAAEAPP